MTDAKPPQAPPPASGASSSTREDADSIRRKYEALLATAKLAYNYEWQRIDAAEAKAARFVPVMAILLGFNAAGLQFFLPVIHAACTFGEWTFLGLFVAFSAANLFALWHFIWALAIAKVMGLPVDKTLPDLFKQERYVDTLYQMSDAFFAATQRAREHTEVKIRHLKRGYWGLVVALITGVGTVASYVIIAS